MGENTVVYPSVPWDLHNSPYGDLSQPIVAHRGVARRYLNSRSVNPQGHKKIGVVFPWESEVVHPAFEERIAGFRRALAEEGVDPVADWIQYANGKGVAGALDAERV